MQFSKRSERNRRVVLIGTGFVGMSFAYALLNQGGVEELVLIDRDVEKAEGEAMDLSHGVAYAPSPMKIWAGSYDDCKEADIVVITAGAAQLPGETRLDLTAKNTIITKGIVKQIMASGFDGVIVVVSNPVDIMTYVVQKASGLDRSRVVGSGTTLDTARLRYMLAQYMNIDSRNVHAYIMAEHGDSSFVPWTHASVGSKNLLELLEDKGNLDMAELQSIYENVRDAAYDIIRRKKATYYGIGMALARLIKAIMNDENSIFTVSAPLSGEYGADDVYIGVPAIIGRNGVREVLDIGLTGEDADKMTASIQTLKKMIKESVEPNL